MITWSRIVLAAVFPCGTVKPHLRSHWWMVVFLTLGVTSSATALSAQQFSTRVFGGYGPTNGYGAGVGADAGVQFPFPFLVHRPVFLGVWGAYHAGSEFRDEDTGLVVEQNIVMYGLEGAGVWLDEPIYIRVMRPGSLPGRFTRSFFLPVEPEHATG